MLHWRTPCTAVFMAGVFLASALLPIVPALKSFFGNFQTMQDWQCSMYIFLIYLAFIICQGTSTSPVVVRSVLHFTRTCALLQHGPPDAAKFAIAPPCSSSDMSGSHAFGSAPSADTNTHNSCPSLLQRMLSAGHVVGSRCALCVVNCFGHVVRLLVWQLMAMVCYGGAVVAELDVAATWWVQHKHGSMAVQGLGPAGAATPISTQLGHGSLGLGAQHLQPQQPLSGQARLGTHHAQHAAPAARAGVDSLEQVLVSERCISAMLAILMNCPMVLIGLFKLAIILAVTDGWHLNTAIAAASVAITGLSGVVTLTRFVCACCLGGKSLRRWQTWLLFCCTAVHVLSGVVQQAYCVVWAFSLYGSNGATVYSMLVTGYTLVLVLCNSKARRQMSAGWSTSKVLLVGTVLVGSFSGVSLDWPALVDAFESAATGYQLERERTWCRTVLFSRMTVVHVALRSATNLLVLFVFQHVPGKPPCSINVALQPAAIAAFWAGSGASAAFGGGQSTEAVARSATSTTPQLALDTFVLGCWQCSLPVQLRAGRQLVLGGVGMWVAAAALIGVNLLAYATAYLAVVRMWPLPSAARLSHTRVQVVVHPSCSTSPTNGGGAQQRSTGSATAAVPSQCQQVSNVLQYVAAYTLAVLAVMVAIAVKHPWFKLSGYVSLAVVMAGLQYVTISWGALEEALPSCRSVWRAFGGPVFAGMQA